MNWEALIPIGVGVIGLITTLVRRQGAPTKLRDRIALDLEIRKSLPEDWDAASFDAHVQTEIGRLLEHEKRQVDWVEITISIATSVLFALPLVWAWRVWRGWWWIGLVFAALMLLGGLMTAYEEWKSPHRTPDAAPPGSDKP